MQIKLWLIRVSDGNTKLKLPPTTLDFIILSWGKPTKATYLNTLSCLSSGEIQRTEGSIRRKQSPFPGKWLLNATSHLSTHLARFCRTTTLETTRTVLPLQGAFARDTGVINSTLLLLKQHHSMAICASESADAATGPAGCGMIGFWIHSETPHTSTHPNPLGDCSAQ